MCCYRRKKEFLRFFTSKTNLEEWTGGMNVKEPRKHVLFRIEETSTLLNIKKEKIDGDLLQIHT
jgi:hypothetical protein